VTAATSGGWECGHSYFSNRDADFYPGLAYFNEVDRGGHFAAWEQPALFASELRAAFRPLR